MFRPTIAAAAAVASLLLVACEESRQMTLEPDNLSAVRKAGGTVRLVQLMDGCDPESFNAAVGAGTCLRKGGILFGHFLGLLEKHQRIGAWHFAPGTVNARVGQTLRAVNHGGEVHTFTEVEEFGGGIIPDLNTLAGTPTPAPECLGLGPGDFVPPGASFTDEVEEAGTERYQCCIHPWMRAIVHAR